MQKIVEVSDLTYYYGKLAALQEINLTVQEGDFFALFGEDDAGKTTLLHLLMGFDERYSGSLNVLGGKPNSLDKNKRQQIRFVPDDIIWEPKITAGDYFRFYGAGGSYNMELQRSLCDSFHINSQEKLLNMTYRDNKLVQLIAAICAEPGLIILDEPVNFLDMETYRSLLELLRQWNGKGATILMAVEKYADIRFFCNKYAYIKEGRIQRQGAVPDPDYRWKVVTVHGGNQDYLREHMNRFLFERNGLCYYLYCMDMSLLPQFLKLSGCMDCTVEEMTFEEEMNEDFSRWSLEKL